MKINPDIMPYLNGELFSNGYNMHIDSKFIEIKREEAILSIVKGKKVIHLGCLDHIPLIETKIKNNTWLHGLLTKETERCVGIDINKSGIEEVSKKVHSTNMVYGNILEDEIPEITGSTDWDYMVVGELLEHINNPVYFLNTIREKYKRHVNKMLLSVPNILTINNFKNLKHQKEIINSDHKYWFTPYTILKVLNEAGLKTTDITFANRIPLNKWELAVRKIKSSLNSKNKYPFSYYSTIIVTASL